MKNWKDLKKELLQNKEIANQYDRLKPHYRIISQLIEARLRKGVTQEQLARKVGTKQSAIARLESGNANPSLDFLEKVTKAVDSEIVIQTK